MAWYPQADNPPLPGMIFGMGHSRRATDIVRGERPRLVEFANLACGAFRRSTPVTFVTRLKPSVALRATLLRAPDIA